jgi:hypothetical protein
MEHGTCPGGNAGLFRNKGRRGGIMPNDVNWPDMIWNEINDAVVKEVAKVRIAQEVFPTTVFDNDPTEVLNDVITFPALTIQEGSTDVGSNGG